MCASRRDPPTSTAAAGRAGHPRIPTAAPVPAPPRLLTPAEATSLGGLLQWTFIPGTGFVFRSRRHFGSCGDPPPKTQQNAPPPLGPVPLCLRPRVLRLARLLLPLHPASVPATAASRPFWPSTLSRRLHNFRAPSSATTASALALPPSSPSAAGSSPPAAPAVLPSAPRISDPITHVAVLQSQLAEALKQCADLRLGLWALQAACTATRPR